MIQTSDQTHDTNPLISVIIPTAGRNPALQACLRSCIEQKTPGLNIEILVIANPPCDEVERLCIALSTPSRTLCYLSTERRGVNRARNLGVRRSHGNYLLFLDDDCVLPHDQWMRDLILVWNEHPHASAVGGGYLDPSEATWLERGHNRVSNTWIARSHPFASSRVSRLLGGNTCYKRNVVSNTPFNEHIISGGDEAELNKRLFDSGHTLILDPRLFIEHRNGNTLQKTIRRAWSHGRAAVQYGLTKHRNAKPAGLGVTSQVFNLLRMDAPVALFFALHYSVLSLAALLQLGIEAKQHIHRRARGRNQIHERRENHTHGRRRGR